MEMTRTFDPGPLTWVKGEIEQALGRAEQALAAAASDPTQLKFARNHLHQANGALAMVGLEGVTRLAELAEQLLQGLESGEIATSTAATTAVTQAILAIRSYLDGLMAGAPDQPLRLWLPYQALAVARGQTGVHRADLFFPDLSARPARRAPAEGLDADAFKGLLKRERLNFQKGLLGWIKQPAAAGLSPMRAAIAAVEAAMELPADRVFWWIALAFVDALAEPALAGDARARHVCSQIDGQFRRLLEGTRSVPEKLLRDALYFVALAPVTAGEAVAAVQATFSLASLLPAATDESAPAPVAPPGLRRLRETLQAADEAWAKVAGGSSNGLGAFADLAGATAGLTAELGVTDLKRLGQGFSTMARWLLDNPARLSQTVAVELATAILLLQEACDQFPGLGADFAAQVDRMVARLHGCMADRPVSDEPLPSLDAKTRRAEERLRVAQVAREIQGHLVHIEQTLDAFFRDPAQRETLAGLEGPVRQVAGALTMLGHRAAVSAVKACEAQIRALATGEADASTFEPLAQALARMGFFVDALTRGETDFSKFAAPGEGEALEAVASEHAAAQVDAGPASPSLEPALADTPVALEPEETSGPADAPLPSVSTRELAEAGQPAVDAELLAIFLEEARDVLQTLAAQFTLLQAAPHNVDALTVIRRGTHTLKGSGRMVGLTDLGETAWELEQTYNLWLSQDKPVTTAILQLAADELELFTRWVDGLAAGQGAAPDPAALIDAARTLRGLPPLIPAEPPLTVAPPALEGDIPEPDQVVADVPGPDAALQATADALAELLVPEDQPAPSEVPATPQIKASPTLYEIFREEAREHLETLNRELGRLSAEPTHAVSFEMTRAAHTLGGIAATVGLMPIHRLAIALEHALLRREGAARPDSVEGLETVRQAILTLEAMYAGLASQQLPTEASPLLAALAEIYPPAPAVDEKAAAASEGDDALAPVTGSESLRPADASVTVVDALDDQLLPVFLEEAAEQLPEMFKRVQSWRAAPAQEIAPRALARLLHTFKGGARMAGAMRLGEATHGLESRLEAAFRGGLDDPSLIEAIETGVDGLAAAVDRLRQGEMPASAETPDEVAGTSERADETAVGEVPTLRIRADRVDQLVNEAGELSIARTRIEGEMRGLKASLLELTENVIRLRRQLRDIEIQAESQIQARVAQHPDASAAFDPLELDRFTRFQELTRFMAESVNDVATVQQNLLRSLDDTQAALLAQARINRSLQQELMRVRMLPFASQTDRLYRVVRQVAKDTGKRASLDIRGGQVELDRSVLERMLGPIEHMLRNAIAHGIEPAAARVAAGKAEVGEITLGLAQEGNDIVLTLADDGAGIDPVRIRDRAVALGRLPAETPVDQVPWQDLIFQPGFSTADAVNALAGRGVGMDVVRTEVAALGGRITLSSTPGAGTQVRIDLPLTLAVTQALLLQAGGRRYALPATMIAQVQELKATPLAALRERGGVDWQGHFYPLHYLPHLLGDPAAVPPVQRQHWVLLLRSGAQRAALQVDALSGQQEVVVKNIGPQLARVPGLTGATVLGDGEVVLILNPVALTDRPAPTLPQEKPGMSAPDVAGAQPPTVLVVDDSLTVRKITSRLLMREGYEVLLAKDGVDALEQLADFRPDVVLSDIEMPRMDGFDLLRNIRADQRLADLPVIMITSRTADKHRSHALELGANAYLGKPYDEADLLSRVAGFCAKKPEQ